MARAMQLRPSGTDRPGRSHLTSRGPAGASLRAQDRDIEAPEQQRSTDRVAASDPGDPRRDVLAVVLTDGSIQLVADPAATETHRPQWRNGRLCGPGWVMWWELRSWDDNRNA